jgi:hypothetical protein
VESGAAALKGRLEDMLRLCRETQQIQLFQTPLRHKMGEWALKGKCYVTHTSV